ncbi:RNA-directed DNA polymerase from mobile element jockey [Trichonephila clavipes]|nr:RNA-directed DNA polymerase from mobile element jockey [Trichonephila clavipes]
MKLCLVGFHYWYDDTTDCSLGNLVYNLVRPMDSLNSFPDKGFALTNLNVDQVSVNIRFLIMSLSNSEMTIISPFAVQKALIGIGGEPKSVKRLRSGDLLVETNSALQTKSFLLAKSFFNSPVTISPHKSLNSCRGIISETDLLGTPDGEILEGFSSQCVIQKNPEKNTSVKIAREQDSPNETSPVSEKSRRRKTFKTSDAMDTDANPSDSDYVIGLASEEDESLLEADFKKKWQIIP